MALLRGRVAEEERARAASVLLCRSLADETQQLRRTLAATAHMCQHLVKCLDERQHVQGDARERSPEVGRGAGRSQWGRPGVGRRPSASQSSGTHFRPHGRGKARHAVGPAGWRNLQSVTEQAARFSSRPQETRHLGPVRRSGGRGSPPNRLRAQLSWAPASAGARRAAISEAGLGASGPAARPAVTGRPAYPRGSSPS